MRMLLVAIALVAFAAESNAQTVIVQRRGIFGGTSIVVGGGLINQNALLLSQGGFLNQNALLLSQGGFFNNGFGFGLGINGGFNRGFNRNVIVNRNGNFLRGGANRNVSRGRR